MKMEENNIQTFCGKDLFKWESWDELDTGTLQFYGATDWSLMLPSVFAKLFPIGGTTKRFFTVIGPMLIG